MKNKLKINNLHSLTLWLMCFLAFHLMQKKVQCHFIFDNLIIIYIRACMSVLQSCSM